MRIKSHSPLLNGYETDAELSTDHPASSYGLPVLVVEDGDKSEACHRTWCSCGDMALSEDPIDFGSFGFYADWE